MTKNEFELLQIIRKHNDKAKAIEIATAIIIGFLKAEKLNRQESESKATRII